MRNIVVRCDGKGMCPKRFAVPPVGRLNHCCPGECNDYYSRRSDSKPCSGLVDCCQVSNEPNCKHKQSDMRKVSVAIGMALLAHLNEADNWDQHIGIPEPPSEQVRSLLP